MLFGSKEFWHIYRVQNLPVSHIAFIGVRASTVGEFFRTFGRMVEMLLGLSVILKLLALLLLFH
jgi:hypothetical protein